MIDTQVRAGECHRLSSGKGQIHGAGAGVGTSQGMKSSRAREPNRLVVPQTSTVGGLTWLSPQGPPGCGLLLFRVGAEASCQKGERVLLTQYLGEGGPDSLQPTLHLICTQVSVTFPLLSLCTVSASP